MKRAWTILLISALVDGSIASITGIMTILTIPLLGPTDANVPWSSSLLVVPILGGALIFVKTIQSALGQTSTMIAELRGKPVITTTVLPDGDKGGKLPEVITKTPASTVFETHLAAKGGPIWPPPPLPPAPVPLSPPVVVPLDTRIVLIEKLLAELKAKPTQETR